MRAGGGKAKGASFERDTCRRLSLWVSHGAREDLYWRSAMSGGRATVAGRRGVNLAAQAGDISSVDKAGHVLTEHCYFETKHVKDIGLDNFVVKNSGALAGFWLVAKREAASYDKTPVIIVRQNRFPTLWLSERMVVENLVCSSVRAKASPLATIRAGKKLCTLWNFDTVMSLPFKE